MKSLRSFSEAVSKEADEKELNVDKLVSCLLYTSDAADE